MYKNQLRIISGKWRGRKLAFPDIEGLRPTPDRVRETLFNWLDPVICGARCLDLFAGSGILGFEALSRGADNVVFVDLEKEAISRLRENQQILKCENVETYNLSAEDYLQRAIDPFDVIFLDPPFHKGLITDTCKMLLDKKLLKPRGYIYIESEKEKVELPEGLQILKQKQAGQVQYMLVGLISRHPAA